MTLEELRKKYGLSSENEEVQTNSAFDQIKKKYTTDGDAQNALQAIYDRTNAYLNNHNAYVTSHNKRFENRTGTYEDEYVGDSKKWLDDVTKRQQQLSNDAENILFMIDRYSDYIDPEWADSVKAALKSAGTQQAEIVNFASWDNDYWKQFSINKEIRPGVWMVGGSTYTSWQNNERMKAELSSYDVEKAEKEIEELQYLYDEGLRLNEWIKKYNPSEDAFPESAKAIQNQLNQYGGIENVEKLLNEKKASFNYEAKQYQEDAAITNDPDYAEKSKYVPGVKVEVPWWREFLPALGQESGYEYPLYEAINGNADAQGQLDNEAMSRSEDGGELFALMASDTQSAILSRMTPDEKGRFNYLYHDQGKEASDAYFYRLLPSLRARNRNITENKLKLDAMIDPFGASIERLMMTPLKVGSLGYQLADYITGEGLDPNAPYNAPSYSSTAITQQVAADISAKYGKTNGWFYQLGMSGADYLINTAITGGNQALSLALMSSEVVADTIVQSKDRGLSDDQAIILGGIAGITEYAAEHISWNKLFKGDRSSVRKYIIDNILGEGFEEGGTAIVNFVADLVVSKDQSEWQMMMKAYKADHPNATDNQAFWSCVWEEAKVVGLDTLGGAIMGFGLSGGMSAITSVAHNSQIIDTGKEIINADGGVQALKKTSFDVARTVPTAQAKINAQASMVLDTPAKGWTAWVKNLNNARNTGLLYETVVTTSAQQNKADIVKSLTRGEHHFTESDAGKIADALISIQNGQELTEQQSKLLDSVKNSKKVQQVLEGIINNEQSTLRYRSKKVEDLYNDVNAGTLAKNAGVDVDTVKAVQDVIQENEKADTKSTESALGDFEVSTTGKTIYNGEEVSVQGISGYKNGKLMLKLSNGQVADASQVSYGSESESLIYNTVANMDISSRSANIIINSYLGQKNATSAEQYALGIEEAYRYGQEGTAREKLADSTYASKLNPGEQEFMYRQGQKASGRQTARDQSRVDSAYQQAKKALGQKDTEKAADKKYGVRLSEGLSRETMDESQAASYDLVEQIAPAVKGDILIYEGKKEWGYYDADTDTICLNIHARWSQKSMMAFTLSHELVHRAKAGSPAKFKAFANFLMKEYGKHGADVDAMVAEQLSAATEAGIEMTPEEAYIEVICDACQRMLLDTDAGKKLAEFGAQSKQNKNFVQEFGKWLRELLDKLRSIFRKVEPESLAAKEFQKFDAAAKQILADMFVDMSMDAGEKLSTIHEAGMGKKITASEGGPKMKSGGTYDYSKSFAEQIDDYKAGKIPKGDTLVVGGTPEVFRKIGMIALPMTINTTHIDYALNGTKDFDHHLGEALLKQLPEAIKKPVAIMASGTKANSSLVAMLEIRHNGKQVVVPIVVDGFGRQNGIHIDSNSITSLYGKNYSISKVLHDAIAQEINGQFRLYYLDKNKATALLQKARVPMPKSSATLNGGFIHSIRESGSPVNMKFQNVTETQQFKRWFGDWMKHPNKASKIVNPDGTPKVMYHGSPAQFTIFDKKKARSSGQYGRGFYFTDSQSHAGQYGQQYSVYLNIKNPLEYGKGTVSRAQVRKFLEAVAENEDYSIENYGSYDVDSILQTIMGKSGSMDAFQLIQDINVTAVGDMVEAAELFNKVNGTNFDGIVTATETVAFRPEQIKSATDNIGTFDGSNPDIRYKVPVDAKSPTYEELVAKDPVAVVDVGRNVDGLSYAELKKRVLENVEARKLFDSPHLNNDTGISIFLTPSSFTHAFSNLTADFGVDTILAMDHIDEIIHEAILTHIESPKNPRKAESRVFTFFAAIDGENGAEPIKLKVKEYRSQSLAELPKNIRAYFEKNGIDDTHNRLYDAIALEVIAVESTKKESGASASVASQKRLGAKGTPNSAIKIADLLALVNGDAKKYIPEANGAKPLKLPVGEDTSPRALLANALEGVTQNEIEEQKLQEYREQIGHLDEQERKLQELNAKIKELSFASGPRDTARIAQLREEAQKTANRISIYDKKLLKLEASKPLQQVLDRERKKAYRRAEQKRKDAMEAYRQAADKRISDMKAEYHRKRKAAVSEARESAAKLDAREKLQKLVLDTVKWISYPTKTDVKCPDILKKPYADFLNGIDLSSKRLASGGDPTKNDLRLANAMGSLATALDKIMISQDPSQDVDKVLDTGYLDLPVDFVQKLRDMTENIKDMMVDGDYVVNTMNAAQVRKLSEMIRILNHSIKTMSHLYANLRFANVEALGFDTMKFMDDLGEAENSGGIKDFVQWDNALPYYAFKRFGKGGESVFEGLMDAQDKLAFLAQEIFNFRDKAWTPEEAKAWSEDTHTIKLPNGNNLTLTTADAMSIYCLSRREQGLQHLLGGGTRVVGIRKGSKKAKDSRSLLTIKDIDAINSSLADRQKQVAEAIQEFMSTVCSEWGNEISMKRFLTKEFTERFYFPIESNDENLTVRDPAAQQSDLFRLLNISATKPLTPGANNEVIIRNIFDVFTGHASDMARLNAYGMGLLDYMKWLNYREKTVNDDGQINVIGVRKSMNTAYGDAAMGYVLNLIKDVNGRPSDGGLPSFYTRMLKNAKTAMVGNSLRVAALQITSYPRAALVLSPKSLALGLTKVPNINRAKKYCGIALWKSFGFYDTNISRSIEDQMKGVTDVRQKLIELSLKGAEWGDAITWGCLWNACEYEVAATNRYKVGTEEFYQAVGKKLREVVYRTQVVDSTLTRSQMMRSKNSQAQVVSSFMSEPTLSANIIMDAGFEFNMEKRRTGSAKAAWRKTGTYIARAVAVYSIGQLAAALVESLFDAWRDEEDEKFWEKLRKAFGKNLILDLLPFNKIPIISEIVEAALSLVSLGYFSADDMYSTALTQTVSAINSWASVFKDNSSTTVYNALYKSVRATSSWYGVSFSGAMREAVDLWNNTAGAYDKTLKILKNKRSGDESGVLLYNAIVTGNDASLARLKATYKDEDAYHTAVSKALRENDPRIREAALVQLNGDPSERGRIQAEIVKDGFDRKDVFNAIAAEVNKLKDSPEDESAPKEKATYTTDDFVQEFINGDADALTEIQDDILETHAVNGKSEDEAKKSFKSSLTSSAKEYYLDGQLDAAGAKKILVQYTDMDSTEASERVRYWSFQQENPDYEHLSEANVNGYYDYAKPAKISLAVYDDFLNRTKGLATIKDKDGNVKTKKQEQVWDVIDSLRLTDSQKDALHLAAGFAESSLEDAPWN